MAAVWDAGKEKRENMFEKNTKQVNYMIAKILGICTVAILAMVIGSALGVFAFGQTYTKITLLAGLFITISPSLLIRILPDHVMKYYMLTIMAVFIGIIGTSNHVGVYITYILVPIFSCLYFEPKVVIRMELISYVIMLLSIYVSTATKYEVVYEHMDRLSIFVSYALGYTMEYLIVSVVLYDIVKRAKRMMEERFSAEEENRKKSRFLSSMSHEIRTPMNAIIGMADVALRKDMSEDIRKCLTIIRSSSTGLLEIINDILDLSKIEAGKFNIIEDVYSTDGLLDEMKAVIDARNMEKKLPIYYHVQKMPAYLTGDAVRIRQVMLNYASNAIKYTEQGRIDIYVDCRKLDADTVLLGYRVKDTGQGVRQEDIGKLFTMYSQFNQEENHGKEGTGIGLAISKSFVDCMGGTVGVDSVYGEGSTFSFQIPQKIADPDVVTEKPQTKENIRTETEEIFGYRTKNTRILLVDDNRINREVVKDLLEPLAATIDEAKDGKEAVDSAWRVTYDLIFMDSHMPVMNGEEATIQIRSGQDGKNRTTPIIAITADAIAGVREKLLETGMNDYIVKPIDEKIIGDMIRKYLPADKIIDIK